MNRCTIILLLILFVLNASSAFNNGEFIRPRASEDIKKRLASARDHFSKNPQKGIASMREVIRYCEENSYDSINLFDAYFELGILYYRTSAMDSALVAFRSSKQVAEDNKELFMLYRSCIGFTRVYSFLGVYDSAEYYTRTGLKYSKGAGYRRGMANNYNQLGVLAGHRGEMDTATYYKEKALELSIEEKDTIGIFSAAYNLAIHLQGSKEYEKCFKYGLQALEIARLSNMYYQMGHANTVISFTYSTLGDNEKALEYLQAAYEAHQKSLEKGEVESHVKYLAFTHYKRGAILNEMDSFDLARTYIRKAILFYDSTQHLESRTDAYAKFSASYRLSGQYDSALYYAIIAKNLGNQSDHIVEKIGGNMALA
ncbi:MAG: tetratricopeptide repeat protein, partial [Cyclobacteriaceae bacterium]